MRAVISPCSASWLVLPSSACQYQLQFHGDKLRWSPLKWQGKHKKSRSPQRAPGIPYLLSCLRASLLLCTLRDCIDSSWPSAVSPLWLTLVQPTRVLLQTLTGCQQDTNFLMVSWWNRPTSQLWGSSSQEAAHIFYPTRESKLGAEGDSKAGRAVSFLGAQTCSTSARTMLVMGQTQFKTTKQICTDKARAWSSQEVKSLLWDQQGTWPITGIAQAQGWRPKFQCRSHAKCRRTPCSFL